MKTTYTVIILSLCVASFTKCKPAAEDRVKMHENAKRISDSIGRVIDEAMEEVKIDPNSIPVAKPVAPATADTSKKAK
jgi:hypothetical protein